jgi:alpha-tubulin suppressor-like RCC1 family protein
MLTVVGGSYGAAPVNTVAPVVTGTTTVGSTLTTTDGTWTGAPAPTFTYQWFRSPSTSIGGATSSTYVLVTGDRGFGIFCRVKATNTIAPSGVTADSNTTATVTSVPDAPTIGTATSTGSTTATVAFTQPANNGGSTITSYTATSSPSGITGTLNQAGSGTITVSGLAASTSYTFTVTATNAVGTSAASSASNSITTDVARELWVSGRNNFGQLGLGDSGVYTDRSSPTQVGSLTNWSVTSGGEQFTAAVKTDGTFWTWGRNSSGQLGLGTSGAAYAYSSPKQVGSLTGWSKVSTGYAHVLALKTDGTLWSWGKNDGGGPLGLGNTTFYSSPKQVGSLTTWATIAASLGSTASMGVSTGGTLFTWGGNVYGKLGLGNTTNYSSPKQVGALTTWSKIAMGGASSAAIKTDGTLWTWGYNGAGTGGVLGLGNTTNYSSPKQVGALTTWSGISVNGGGHMLAVKTDGTLWTWGAGSYGRLGLGNTTSYSSPKQIGALTTWSKVAGNNVFSIAIKTDGTLWTWGRNNVGQLGQNNLTNRSSPVQVGALTTWLTIAGGYNWLLATKST